MRLILAVAADPNLGLGLTDLLNLTRAVQDGVFWVKVCCGVSVGCGLLAIYLAGNRGGSAK